MVYDTEQTRICGYCGYPLEWDGDLWFHVLAVADPFYDHEVIPLEPAAAIFVKRRCDFCDRELATDIVLSESFDMPDGISRSIGHWAACEQCAEFVRRGAWGRLITYIKQTAPIARRTPRRHYVDLYAVLARNMYGVMSLSEWRKRSE